MGRVKVNNDPTPSLKHFSHPHELELCAQLQDLSPCSGCRLPPLGQMYICKPCNFTLHLSCAKFPKLITHPSHPDHTLDLVPTSKYPGGIFNCDACNHRGNGFSYHCSNCEFDLHVICATKPLKITHQSHQCSLELTFKNPYADAKGFSCDACKKLGAKQWLYRCHTCEFDVHLDCSTAAPKQAVQAPASRPVPLQHHHSFPGSTNQFQQATMGTQARSVPYMQAPMGAGQVRPNQLLHSASTSAIPQQQFQQPHIIQGQVMPNQFMQPQGANFGLGNLMMTAALQGVVEGAAQQVGSTIMQGFIGGGNGNEGPSVLGSIFGGSSDTQY